MLVYKSNHIINTISMNWNDLQYLMNHYESLINHFFLFSRFYGHWFGLKDYFFYHLWIHIHLLSHFIIQSNSSSLKLQQSFKTSYWKFNSLFELRLIMLQRKKNLFVVKMSYIFFKRENYPCWKKTVYRVKKNWYPKWKKIVPIVKEIHL